MGQGSGWPGLAERGAEGNRGLRMCLARSIPCALWSGSAGIPAGANLFHIAQHPWTPPRRQGCRRSQVSHLRDTSLNRYWAEAHRYRHGVAPRPHSKPSRPVHPLEMSKKRVSFPIRVIRAIRAIRGKNSGNLCNPRVVGQARRHGRHGELFLFGRRFAELEDLTARGFDAFRNAPFMK